MPQQIKNGKFHLEFDSIACILFAFISAAWASELEPINAMRNDIKAGRVGERALSTSFVENPNLPEGKVKLVFIGRKYAEKLNLKDYGIDALLLDEYQGLESAVSSHSDMQVVHLYSNNFMSIKNVNCKVKELYNIYCGNDNCKAGNLDIKIMSGTEIDMSEYPKSAAYNVLILGKFTFFNDKCIDPLLKDYLKDRYKLRNVRQGYARCSSCVVSENAVITADSTIAKALTDEGIDVLKITQGFIKLDGYDYGFIGGASFKIDKDKLAFTGSLDGHPDKNAIQNFVRYHGAEPVFLSQEPIFDIGSAIPVLEER